MKYLLLTLAILTSTAGAVPNGVAAIEADPQVKELLAKFERQSHFPGVTTEDFARFKELRKGLAVAMTSYSPNKLPSDQEFLRVTREYTEFLAISDLMLEGLSKELNKKSNAALGMGVTGIILAGLTIGLGATSYNLFQALRQPTTATTRMGRFARRSMQVTGTLASGAGTLATFGLSAAYLLSADSTRSNAAQKQALLTEARDFLVNFRSAVQYESSTIRLMMNAVAK